MNVSSTFRKRKGDKDMGSLFPIYEMEVKLLETFESVDYPVAIMYLLSNSESVKFSLLNQLIVTEIISEI